YRLRIMGDSGMIPAAFPGATLVADGEFAVPAISVVELNASLQAALAAGAQVTSLAPSESALETEFHAAVGAGGSR
ncbi:MAG: hypothetical protein P3A28_05430, partial [Gemmatimonadota bacterium]|nr:hypothetical protein [Gemmatimonadota bacterium]